MRDLILQLSKSSIYSTKATNRLTGFNTLKFHCWLNTLLNDFYHLNHWLILIVICF